MGGTGVKGGGHSCKDGIAGGAVVRGGNSCKDAIVGIVGGREVVEDGERVGTRGEAFFFGTE